MRKIYYISILIIVAGLSALGWFFGYLVDAEKNKIKTELEIEAIKVERILADNFDHTDSILDSINEQIKEDPYNKKYIYDVLKRYKTNVDLANAFSWTIFSWADSAHQITVDATYGIMKEPFDLSIRDYVHYAKAEPGKFILGNPVVGSTSKKWMIPGGTGLLDKNGKFAGTMTIGFEIDILAKIIQSAMQSKNVKIFIYDTKNNLPIFSVKCEFLGPFEAINVDKNYRTVKIHSFLTKLKTEKSAKIYDIDILFKQEGYLVQNIKNYPLAIVLEYDHQTILDELWLSVYSRLFEIIFILLVAILLMWLINKIKTEQINDNANRRKIDKINRVTSEILTSLSNQLKKQVLQINQVVKQLKSSFSESDLDVKQELYLQELRELSKNSLQFLEDLIDINWAGNKNFSVDMKNKIDINDLIRRIILINNPAAIKKKISLEFDSEKTLWEINLDQKAMKQILMNLISNSIKHSLANSTIKIDAKKIQNKLRISIKDSGYGIKPEKIAKILNEKNNFDDFKSSSDFGVGLSLVKKLVDLQKGEIEIISRANKGTEIILCFNY